jgi:pimeloyl-ACP methyl ester carboxylesterase
MVWACIRLRAALTFSFVLLALSFVLLTDVTGIGGGSAENLADAASKDFYWLDVRTFSYTDILTYNSGQFQIEPSHELVWNTCYKPLHRECARLLVPLNHLNHSDESPDYAAIALIRVPSPFSSSSSRPHPRYRGPILFNPGGPGGSGVDLVLRVGDLFAQVVGSEFDIVSFDPRGVARSTPKVSYFEGMGRGEREVWGPKGLDVIHGGLSDQFNDMKGEKGRSLEKAWIHNVVSNERAAERAGQWLGNVNTEQTANDMLSIVHAHGREKLMYRGFSYGTVLGSTFASLFPVCCN